MSKIKAPKLELKTILIILTVLSGLLLLLVGWVFPEVPTALYTFGGVFVACLIGLVVISRQRLKAASSSRSVRAGANSAVNLGLVIAILIVLSFLNFHHYYKKDLTKDNVHSLSEQTLKILKDLKQDIQVAVYTNFQTRDAAKQVLDNYNYLSKGKFKVEYIDPNRDPDRAKAAGIKKLNTVVLTSGKKEIRVEEITEEKLTNGLIKLLKSKTVQVCFLSGHGEKNPEASDPEGYSNIKQELTAQVYESKVFSLMEEAKVPESCAIVLVLGSNRAFFEKEITILKEWLNAGGRALFALDPNLKGGIDFHPELTALLSEWFIDVKHNLILDPTSRLMGTSASTPVVATYSMEHPTTRDFKFASIFPLSSSVELKPNVPMTLKTWWLAKSTPNAVTKNDFKEIASGQVKLSATDSKGPHAVMVAVEGNIKDPKPSKPARIIALGTSQLASNAYARHGANLDLFMNAVSWLADDENLISIRPKEELAQIPSLSQTEARMVQLLTMFAIPGTVLFAGGMVYVRRRRL